MPPIRGGGCNDRPIAVCPIPRTSQERLTGAQLSSMAEAQDRINAKYKAKVFTHYAFNAAGVIQKVICPRNNLQFSFALVVPTFILAE